MPTTRWMTWGIVLAWLATRAALFAQTLQEQAWDVELYRRWGQLVSQGTFPVGDPEYQYPPGAGIIFALLWPEGDGYFRRFTILALACDAAIVGILLAARHRRDGSWLGPWTWVLGGFLVGPFLIERYDILPTLVAIAGLVLVARPWAVGSAAGLGAFLKLWPGLILLAVPRRALGKATLWAAAVVVVAWLTTAVFIDNEASFIASQAGRGVQIESLAALPFGVVAALGGRAPDIAERFGSYEIDSSSASLISIVVLALGLSIIAGLLVLRLMGRLETLPGADVVLAAGLVFVLFNKVNSPQYGIWLMGLAAVALLDRRSRMLPAAFALMLATLVTTEVILDRYSALVVADPVLVGFQVVRLALLGFATGYALWVVVRPALGRGARPASQGSASPLRVEPPMGGGTP